MKSSKWIFRSFSLFLFSTIILWFLQDGINCISRIIGRSAYQISPVELFFTYLLTYSIIACIEVILWVKKGFNEFKKQIQKIIEVKLEEQTKSALENSIFKLYWKEFDNNSKTLAEYKIIMKKIMDLINPRINDPYFPAYSVIIEEPIQSINHRIQSIRGEGLSLSNGESLRITQQLAGTCKNYTQIQRKAYSASIDWTEDWKAIINFLDREKITSEYIVLMDKSTINKNKDKLDSMNSYLTNKHISFKYCIPTNTITSLANNLPKGGVVESFDNYFAKIQAFGGSSYKNIVSIKITLIDLNENPAVSQFIDYVRDDAITYTGSSH